MRENASKKRSLPSRDSADSRRAVDAAAARPVEARGTLGDLGSRIRAIRKERGLSLAQLSTQSQISVAMLSHIERGRTDPSLKTLDKIRAALRVTMNQLFPPSDDHSVAQVVRRANRKRLDFKEIGLTKYKLSPNDDSDLEVFLLVLKPGGNSGPEPWSRVGEKAGTVIRGQLELKIGSTDYHLEPGDSFQFDSAQAHCFANVGREVAEVIWIIKSSPFPEAQKWNL